MTCSTNADNLSEAATLTSAVGRGIWVAAAGTALVPGGQPYALALAGLGGIVQVTGELMDYGSWIMEKSCDQHFNNSSSSDSLAGWTFGTVNPGEGGDPGFRGSWGTACGAANGTPVPCFEYYVPPIVLDLTGDGFSWRSISSGPLIDPDNDGRANRVGWVGPNDGILVYDANNDGVGSYDEWNLTAWALVGGTDLDALRTADTNGDGFFSLADRHFAQFKVGRDFNQNGRFEAGELQSLASAGVSYIRLASGVSKISSPDNPLEVVPGVYHFNTGQFVRTNGTVGSFVDAGFQVDPYTALTYSGSSHSIVSHGSSNTFAQAGAVPLSMTASATYRDIVGGDGADYLVGDARANYLIGRGGSDYLIGQGGDDIIVIDQSDVLGRYNGGTGRDTLVRVSDTSFSFDAGAHGFESVVTGSGNDYLYSSFVPVVGSYGVALFGGKGNDQLIGTSGEDVLQGGEGVDRLYGGHSDDVLIVDGQDNLAFVNGGAFSDTLIVTGGVGVVIPNLRAMEIEAIVGSDGNDTIYAAPRDGSPNVRYYETLAGGGGNDFLYGKGGGDTYLWSPGDGHDTIAEDSNYAAARDELVIDASASRLSFAMYSNGLRVSVSGSDGGSVFVRDFYAGTDTTRMSHNVDNLVVDGRAYDLGHVVRTFIVNGYYPWGTGTLYGGGSGGGSGGGGSGGGGGGGGEGPPGGHPWTPLRDLLQFEDNSLLGVYTGPNPYTVGDPLYFENQVAAGSPLPEGMFFPQPDVFDFRGVPELHVV